MNAAASLIAVTEDLGFTHARDVVHIFAGGSHQHGARLGDTSDLDVCGVYVPRPAAALGFDAPEHFVASTGGDAVRNSAGDVDVTLYTLRRWAFLAAKGNPTVLSYLFMPAHVPGVWAEWIASCRDVFLASSHAKQFLGFGNAQRQRLNGERGTGRHGQRDPLIDAFGYDTKCAMHMLRVMFECRELLTDGTMTFPRPEVELLLEVRRGEWTKAKVERHYLALEKDVEQKMTQSRLPAEVDRAAISTLIAEAYLGHWRRV